MYSVLAATTGAGVSVGPTVWVAVAVAVAVMVAVGVGVVVAVAVAVAVGVAVGVWAPTGAAGRKSPRIVGMIHSSAKRAREVWRIVVSRSIYWRGD
jgi:hypothetical protein